MKIDLSSLTEGKISLLALIIIIFTYLSKAELVSVITAQNLEKKLLSKEKNFINKTFRYLFNVFIFTLIIFSVANLIKGSYNFWVALSLLLISELIIMYFISKNTNITFKSFKQTSLKFDIMLFFIFFLLVIFGFAMFVSEIFMVSDNKSQNFTIFITALIISFMFSIALPLIVKPGLKTINWYNEKTVYIIEDGQKWFILHPINNDSILLGNSKTPNECTKNKLINKEYLLNKIIYTASKTR